MNPVQLLQQAKRLVVKIGTGILTTSDHQLDEARIRQLAEEILRLRTQQRQVILVSSGAIAAGMGILGWTRRPKELVRSQAAAAVGQGRLMQAYSTAFNRYGVTVAQILLTREDLTQRRRYINARQTMRALWDEGVVPIVNENDTVAVDEIRFGDNDELSALAAQLMDAQMLVILTDVDGFERRSPDGSRELIPIVEKITPEIERFAGGAGRSTSTGGMISKLKAARMAGAGGIPTLLANGTKAGILTSLFVEGHLSGTLFLPSQGKRLGARKRWLAFTGRPKGTLKVDEGAHRALVSHSCSLLASGIRQVEGSFRRGDLVSIRDEEGQEFARGLVNYPVGELAQILGFKSEQIAVILGRKAEEAVHRDSLVVLQA